MADAPTSEDLPLRDDDDNRASSCGKFADAVLRYLDNDLRGKELEEFRAHLDSCAPCRDRLEAEGALSRLLHRTRPLYSAPATLRARVSAISVQDAVPGTAAETPHPRFLPFPGGQVPGAARHLLNWRVLAPALLVLAVCLTLVPDITRQVQAASYARTAVADHLNYLNGNLRLGLQSGSPQVVTAWFADKVPFDFRLPAVESTLQNEPAYKLTGAAVVSYKGNPAALVTYDSQAGKISLLVVSANSAVVAGGEEVHYGKLTFHYRTDAAYKVITWSNHGLAYALVSSVSGSPKTSCLVCHQNMEDRGNFKARP